jgi:hypothetical protein
MTGAGSSTTARPATAIPTSGSSPSRGDREHCACRRTSLSRRPKLRKFRAGVRETHPPYARLRGGRRRTIRLVKNASLTMHLAPASAVDVQRKTAAPSRGRGFKCLISKGEFNHTGGHRQNFLALPAFFQRDHRRRHDEIAKYRPWWCSTRRRAAAGIEKQADIRAARAACALCACQNTSRLPACGDARPARRCQAPLSSSKSRCAVLPR